ncbi:helix-turn-helix domain-containing protein [Erysipelothrix anatis]|uniref:helix-turn-helix domain-containing protein n=1 Tax=Erysipelothrix anatis TaxID=2683713 RepID=UPI0014096B40|nr:helix-turn-helix domain-containing protein [Erysipelothrix anatis]
MSKPRGKYVRWLEPKNLMLLESWARKLTNEQIAVNIGISPKTLYSWMNTYPEIREAVSRGKEVVVSEVEHALLKRAKGYTETVEKVKVLNDGGIIRYKEDVHYPPDTTAAIFALKNMDPTNWRDKHELEHSGDISLSDQVKKVDDYIQARVGDKK